MILAVLQARFSSSRLPGKVLKQILGKPMLARQIERVKRSKLIDHLVVATSDTPSDDPIDYLCEEQGVECYRGNLEDVLDRFYHAARGHAPEHVVRLTGDCPLADPAVIDEVIGFHLKGEFDYSSNTLEPTFPDGLDVEICTFLCLEITWKEAMLPSQREHVTSFIHQQPERFKLGSFTQAENLSQLRWTVDESEDFKLVAEIYEALYPRNSAFTIRDILTLLESDTRLQTINTGYQRNEGYLASMQKDADFLNSKGTNHEKNN